jgi:carbon-monoxide dehydrogenase iron sulfur subunit
MRKQLYALPDKCTGCNRCAIACSARHEGFFRPSRARIHINNYSFDGYSVPNICFQCPGAACQRSCPKGAISRDEYDVGVVDKELCIGCGQCVAACPYGMIDLGNDQFAYKCNYCHGNPACVPECLSGALLFQEKDYALVKIRSLQMKYGLDSDNPQEKRENLGKRILINARSVI